MSSPVWPSWKPSGASRAASARAAGAGAASAAARRRRDGVYESSRGRARAPLPLRPASSATRLRSARASPLSAAAEDAGADSDAGAGAAPASASAAGAGTRTGTRSACPCSLGNARAARARRALLPLSLSATPAAGNVDVLAAGIAIARAGQVPLGCVADRGPHGGAVTLVARPASLRVRHSVCAAPPSTKPCRRLPRRRCRLRQPACPHCLKSAPARSRPIAPSAPAGGSAGGALVGRLRPGARWASRATASV